MPCPLKRIMIENHSLPHRHTIRLPEFDYSRDGVYFITIDAFDKGAVFGDVFKGKMFLSEPGLVADECWRQIPGHFPKTSLYDYVVMPDHLHGLIAILNEREGDGHNLKTDTACRVPTEGKEVFSHPTQGSIPTVVRSYKSAVTKLVHERFPSKMEKVWQSRYYERVIRNERELREAISYIRSNPANWEERRQSVL